MSLSGFAFRRKPELMSPPAKKQKGQRSAGLLYYDNWWQSYAIAASCLWVALLAVLAAF